MAWNADIEWVRPDEAENAHHDRQHVVRRGRLEEGAAKSIRGSGRVRQQRAWAQSGAALAIPAHKSNSDVGAALALAHLSGPLEPLLLLVCCEDLAQWPTITRFALPVLNHPHGLAALTDAMHCLMWRRPVMSLAKRAASLKVRRENYARLRRQADALLHCWLEMAAQRFLTALRD
jgi:hypothetical protein